MSDEVLEGQIHVDELLNGVKIWCETCEGYSKLYHYPDCSACGNKGYTKLTSADLKELQNIADKWTDAATQEELYLGRCVKAAFNMPRFAMIFGESENEIFDFAVVEELIEWGKRQGVE